MSELTDAVEAREPEVSSEGGTQHLGWALVLICIAQLMVVLDATTSARTCTCPARTSPGS
jgi:hypothetical protein